MIIIRHKGSSSGPEQREFNSQAAKERNYKWLKKITREPVDGVEHIINRYQIPLQSKKTSDKLKGIDEAFRVQKDLKHAADLSLETENRKIRAKYASNGNRRRLQEKAERLDNIADIKEKGNEKIYPNGSKEYNKSSKIRKRLRDTQHEVEVAEEKAHLRGNKKERDFLEERVNKAKKLTERDNKLAKIKEYNKFSNKLKRGLKRVIPRLIK